MTTFFISDLHLDMSRSDITDIFLRFLKKEALQADALYILGDLFEAWIGDDDSAPLHQLVIEALKMVTEAGVPVFVMQGNRDFLLGEHFAEQTGCQLLPDPSVISLYGRPTLLMHGDTLCTADKAYLRYRAFVRSFFCKKLFLGLPLKWRQRIAERLRKASRQHTTSIDDSMMDVTDSEIVRQMRRYKVNQLIHGHTHRPMIRYFNLSQDELGRHIVLGDWDTNAYILACQSATSMRLINIS